MNPPDLMPLVYDGPRKLASARLPGVYAGNTLEPTALVHEAWLKLANASVDWQDRTDFQRTAATAMRRILVDRARVRQTARLGAGV